MQNSVLIMAGAALLGLTACGGGSSGSAQPQFAGAEPPEGIEDIVGLTFPLRVASLGFTGGSVDEVTRDTWSLRFTSPTTAVLTSAFGTFQLTQDGDDFVGSNGAFDVEMTSPNGGEYAGLVLIDTGNADAMTGSAGAGFFGLQTTIEDIDVLIDGDAVATYEGGSVLFVEYGDELSDIEQLDGTTDLTADFGAGTVTGSLLETASSTISVVDGTIAENGFSGTMAVGGDLAIIMSIDTSDVDGFFFGGSAEELVGSFEGTGTYAAEPATFGGVFGGLVGP